MFAFPLTLPTFVRRRMQVTIGVLSLSCCAFAQSQISNAKSVLQLTEEQQRQFVTSVLDSGFPEGEGDRFSLLLVNRSSLVVPILESRVVLELERSVPSNRLIELASAMIAYAGDEQALRAVSKLVAIDEKRFGPLVNRTLDNAANWRNPFTVAYRGLELGDDAISRRIAEWAESDLKSVRMQRAWAEAMLDRCGRVPVEADLVKDPIASRLANGLQADLQRRILQFATEARNKQ